MQNMKILDEEDCKKVLYLRINVPRLTIENIREINRSREKKHKGKRSSLLKLGVKRARNSSSESRPDNTCFTSRKSKKRSSSVFTRNVSYENGGDVKPDQGSEINSKDLLDKIKGSNTKKRYSCNQNYNSGASEGSDSDNVFFPHFKRKKLKLCDRKNKDFYSSQSESRKKCVRSYELETIKSRQYENSRLHSAESDSDKIFISLCNTEIVTNVSTVLEVGPNKPEKIEVEARSFQKNRSESILELKKSNTAVKPETVGDEFKYEDKSIHKQEAERKSNESKSASDETFCEQISAMVTTKCILSESTSLESQISETSVGKEQVSNTKSPSSSKPSVKECFVVLEKISVPQLNAIKTQNDGITLRESSSSFQPDANALIKTENKSSDNFTSVSEKLVTFCVLDMASICSVTSTFKNDQLEKIPKKSSNESMLLKQKPSLEQKLTSHIGDYLNDASKECEPVVTRPHVTDTSKYVNSRKELQIVLPKIDKTPIWKKMKSNSTINLKPLCETEINDTDNLSVCVKIPLDGLKNSSQMSGSVSVEKIKDTSLKDVSNMPIIATTKSISKSSFKHKDVPLSDKSTFVHEVKSTKKISKINELTKTIKCTGDSTKDRSILPLNVTFGSLSTSDKSEDIPRLTDKKSSISKPTHEPNTSSKNKNLKKLYSQPRDVALEPFEKSVELETIPEVNPSVHRNQFKLGLQTSETSTSLTDRFMSDISNDTSKATVDGSNKSNRESECHIPNKFTLNNQLKSSAEIRVTHPSTILTEIVDTSLKNLNTTLKSKNNSSSLKKSVLCNKQKSRNSDYNSLKISRKLDKSSLCSSTKPHKIDNTPKDSSPLSVNKPTQLSSGFDKPSKLNNKSTYNKQKSLTKWQEIDLFTENKTYNNNKTINIPQVTISRNTDKLSKSIKNRNGPTSNKPKSNMKCQTKNNCKLKEVSSLPHNSNTDEINESRTNLSCAALNEPKHVFSECETVKNHTAKESSMLSVDDATDLAISSNSDEVNESNTECTSNLLNESVVCSQQKLCTLSIDEVTDLTISDSDEYNEPSTVVNSNTSDKPKSCSKWREFDIFSTCKSIEIHNPLDLTLGKPAFCNKRKRSAESNEISPLLKSGTTNDSTTKHSDLSELITLPSEQSTTHHESELNTETRERSTSTRSEKTEEPNSPKLISKRIVLEIDKPKSDAEMHKTNTALNIKEIISCEWEDEGEFASSSDISLEYNVSAVLKNPSNKSAANSEPEPDTSCNIENTGFNFTQINSPLLFDDSEKDNDTSCEINDAFLLSSKDIRNQNSASPTIKSSEADESKIEVSAPISKTLIGKIRVKTATELDSTICFIDEIRKYNEVPYKSLSNGDKTNLIREQNFNLYKLVQSTFKYKSNSEVNITSLLNEISNHKIRLCGNNLQKSVQVSLGTEKACVKPKVRSRIVLSKSEGQQSRSSNQPENILARQNPLPKPTQSNFMTNRTNSRIPHALTYNFKPHSSYRPLPGWKTCYYPISTFDRGYARPPDEPYRHQRWNGYPDTSNY